MTASSPTASSVVLGRPSLASFMVRHRRWPLVFMLVMVGAWAASVWLFLRPDSLISDWNGWRQTDTQTIALNLMKPGASVLRPEIAWGGAGPGYVETEFQLYTRLVAGLMSCFGVAEWPGQLVSLLAMTGTALMIWVHLAGQFRRGAALAGVIAFLGIRTASHLGTTVMPDSLALLCYVTAWTFFTRYSRLGAGRDLVAFALAGALAMLIKPSMAILGISSFIFLFLGDRARLKELRVWLAWAVMVIAFVTYYGYARTLYVHYGNTFGLLAGEDSKAPHLRHLLMPDVYAGALKNFVRWGVGYFGFMALLVLLTLRKLRPEHVALGVSQVILTFVAMRYMSQDAGNYYFAPAMLLGASMVAAVTNWVLNLPEAAYKQWLLMAGAAVLLLQIGRGMTARYAYAHYYDAEVQSVIRTAHHVDLLTRPGELVVARSPNEAFDVFWQTARNYHDPRVFYVSGTRGWTLGRERGDTALLETARRQGARYFADPLVEPHPVLDAWLHQHAKLVWSERHGGRIWEFLPARS